LVFAGSHVELRTMQWARQGMTSKPAFREASISMSAVVVDGEQFSPDAAHHHTVITQTVDASHLAVGEIVEISRP
jgi:hypothetical protein